MIQTPEIKSNTRNEEFQKQTITLTKEMHQRTKSNTFLKNKQGLEKKKLGSIEAFATRMITMCLTSQK